MWVSGIAADNRTGPKVRLGLLINAKPALVLCSLLPTYSIPVSITYPQKLSAAPFDTVVFYRQKPAPWADLSFLPNLPKIPSFM